MATWSERRARRGLLPAVMLATALGPGGPLAAPAGADQGPGFDIHIDPCVRVHAGSVIRQVAVELGPSVMERLRQAASVIRLSVSCSGSLVALLAHNPETGRALGNTVDLHAQPAGVRQRFLAVAVAELLTASASDGADVGPEEEDKGEEEEPPAPESAAVAGTASKQALVPVPPSPRPSPRGPRGRGGREALEGGLAVSSRARKGVPPLRVLAVGSSQIFFTGPLFLWGAGVQVAGDGAHHLGWSVELLARHGSTALDAGTVAVDTLSLGATLFFQHGWSRLRLRAGAGLRGGLVYLQGQPADPQATEGDTFSGLWAGPVAALALTLAATRHLALEASTEGGYVVLPVGGQVSGVPAVSVRGPFLGVHLGIGFFP